jgi:phosphate/sulfate permease
MNVFILLFLTTLFVAYANGANDNFKGVALYAANVQAIRAKHAAVRGAPPRGPFQSVDLTLTPR